MTYWDILVGRTPTESPNSPNARSPYEPALKQASPYTPQMVVIGTATTVGNSLPEVESLLADAPPLRGPLLTINQDHVDVGAGSEADTADIWLVRYDPQITAGPVARGENTGATLEHTHVVHRLDRLGSWDGHQVSFALPRAPAGLKIAILVQRRNGGPILSAITD